MSGLPELAALRQIVIEAANKAGLSEICLHPAESKADGSIVTALDHEMQALISAQLEARWPQYLFMGEEMDHGEQARIVDGEQRGFWTLDPLDGTTNFAMGFPFYGVSLALVIDGEPHLGVVFDPVRGGMLQRQRWGWRLSGRRALKNTFGGFCSSRLCRKRRLQAAGVRACRSPGALPTLPFPAQSRVVCAGVVLAGGGSSATLSAWGPADVGLRRGQPYPEGGRR